MTTAVSFLFYDKYISVKHFKFVNVSLVCQPPAPVPVMLFSADSCSAWFQISVA